MLLLPRILIIFLYNFQALYAGSVECRCNEEYYRAQPDPRTAACTRAPSAPRNLTRRFLDQTTLILNWDPPLDEGGRSDTQYKIECDVCSNLITFSPASPSSQSSVTLSHLQQGTTYTIRVFSVNGVSNLSLENDNYAEVSVSTGSGAPSVVSNLMISDKKPHQVANPYFIVQDWPISPCRLDLGDHLESHIYSRLILKKITHLMTKQRFQFVVLFCFSYLYPGFLLLIPCWTLTCTRSSTISGIRSRTQPTLFSQRRKV